MDVQRQMRLPSKNTAPPTGHSTPFPLATTLFFGMMFFLCGADWFFATRFWGLNFRWGQLPLFLCFLASLRDWKKEKSLSSPHWFHFRTLLLFWSVFFCVYALTFPFHPSKAMAVKGAWGLFNVGCSLGIVLNPRWRPEASRGMIYGFTLTALSVWAGAVATHWFQPSSLDWQHFARCPIRLDPPLPSLTIGFAQTGYPFEGEVMWRPSAFYYEPSYASCALVFAFFLSLAFNGGPKKAWDFASSLLLGAVVLTNSRSGLFGLALGALACGTLWCVRRHAIPRKQLLQVALAVAILLGAFSIHPGGRKFMFYIFGVYPQYTSLVKLEDPGTSEGGRVAMILAGLRQWRDHPWVGNGVEFKDENDQKKIAVKGENLWLEIADEAGTPGLLAFAFAILGSLALALKQNPSPTLKIYLVGAWTAHLIANLNLTQTFPRLDYWLLFFFSISLAFPKGGWTPAPPGRPLSTPP